MKRLATIALSLFCEMQLTCAQDFPRQGLNLERIADEIFPIQDLDLNYEELYENLAQLLSNPLDLNTVSREQLRSLFVLSEQQIAAFLEYRVTNNPLLSVYELQIIPGWDRQTFDKIIPFVTVHDPLSILGPSIFKRRPHNHYVVFRIERTLEPRSGYKPETDSLQRYAGSPNRLYLRYRMARANDFSLGLTLEKDPGESISWSPAQGQYGFDYLSMHAQVQNKGRLKNLVVGDYHAQFGQGLVLGSTFGFGKNAETVTTVRRSNVGFLPYTSLNEVQFFRGVAGTVNIYRNFYLHGFASFRKRDATGEASDDSFFTAFSTTGMHRTTPELLARKQAEELAAGGVLQFRSQHLDAGITFHHTQFSASIIRNPTAYNRYFFNGFQNQVAAIFLNYTWDNFTFFSEAAHNLGHGSALVTGLLGSITSKLETSLLFRDYAKDYNALTGNAFSENTFPQNERGFYWGWKYKFNRRYSASGYMDIFQFPWLRYRGYAPSEGTEWLLRFNYSPSRSVQLFVQAREESKIRNLSENSAVYSFTNGMKRNYWISCDFEVPPLAFKSRIQASTYNLGGRETSGIALIQDASVSLKRWTFSFRYALFDTEDYDNRLYIYEQDVWLAYSFPAYYGTGLRKYAMVQFALSERVDLWLRWSQVRYTDRDQIGSGGELIDDNTRNDLKFQVRMQF